MSTNLPINLNNGLSKPQTSAHAQNFSTAKLQQRKNIETAKTSMDKAMKGEGFRPVSSVSRIGQSNNSASTSVTHDGSNATQDDDEARRTEVLDKLRYQHIRQMMKDKKNNPDKDKN
ncbi:MAG: hypothetical protein COX80_04670 [Candidatus Magasanikbacteria bacterium CG_4_10_14_0_2_um_filter_33_14]|uniref:Uncharacterized protein n=1 Tax=Candidatus Magasanikbacteria bacterium CG_4_10_14_0_2_um_filter_33_14 TaxID=1974636 RepID=A0A2M7V970_9BACT|nr:MAG: hypothetical protein COX80_04670 [Candidatus Magasanikbacteria bacterium CG_4_10_14_0_2_um_filter_33_14]